MSEPCADLRSLRPGDVILWRSQPHWHPGVVTSRELSVQADGTWHLVLTWRGWVDDSRASAGYTMSVPDHAAEVYAQTIRLPEASEILVGWAHAEGRSVRLPDVGG